MSTEKQIKAYLPMSETAYYILLSLMEHRHGYAIMQHVEAITAGRVRLGAGTLYGTLGKMEKSGLIAVIAEEQQRKVYGITPAGRAVLEAEIRRIRELYKSSEGVRLK
ncbi:MAG: PadR family transcriptional regulator [Oscillospiraceae bacterium]|nr:PadR family transcriptional regulator [Oscillospiraceae bacterium]